MKTRFRKTDLMFALPAGGAGEGVPLFMQAVVQVGFVTSKAGGVPALTARCLDHLKQYLTLLFSRQFDAR